MSAEATFWAWKIDVPSVHHKAVLLCLADCHNSDSKQCNPSVTFIAERTKCNRKTVMKVIGELEQIGLISTSKKLGAGNHYALNTSTTEGTALATSHTKNQKKTSTTQGTATSTADGTSTKKGTSTTDGTTTSTTQGTRPVPPVGHEPTKNLQVNLQDKELGGKNQKFKPPDAGQVSQFFCANGSTNFEAQKFHDHFESNGWKVGGRAPMKSWEAAARNWIRRCNERATQNQSKFEGMNHAGNKNFKSNTASPSKLTPRQHMRQQINSG